MLKLQNLVWRFDFNFLYFFLNYLDTIVEALPLASPLMVVAFRFQRHDLHIQIFV